MTGPPPKISLPPSLPPEKFLTTAEVAELFPLSEANLRKLRSRQRGPVYYTIGRRVYYRAGQLVKWLNLNLKVHRPTGMCKPRSLKIG